ncbi:hypothetical protein GNI_172790 [Gregarina niphandrodes]|uniref:Uncharacterized protein n=1 Tax=Gregarina niphandrodes TaxID=110365 RepID=A0A023AXS3_GRENI|nr:hypothetical protein GNI_172790 [Gregarina niphandrodes]EZG43424.1 hypothetical protein GNI_172790 [Gregarina niphandrodes]|eukprot:XP_011133344.1 hypothetical protein GNI_172790 [Gregarina niphandrodes]
MSGTGDEINTAKKLRMMDTRIMDTRIMDTRMMDLISEDNDALLHLDDCDNNVERPLADRGNDNAINDNAINDNANNDNSDNDDEHGGFLWKFDSNIGIDYMTNVPSTLHECCRCGLRKACIDLLHDRGHNVCRDCRWKYRDDYRTLHQSRVAYDYGLNSRDLMPLFCLVKPNKNSRLQDIKLYFKFQLEEACSKKHGSLQNWISKREEKQLAKFKLLSTAYERSVKAKTPALESKQCRHIHSTKTFNDGLWTETCPDCGHNEKWQEL